MGLVLDAYNPSTWEMKAKVLKIRGQSQLHSKFEARGGYMISQVKKKVNNKRKQNKKLKGLVMQLSWWGAYTMHDALDLFTTQHCKTRHSSTFTWMVPGFLFCQSFLGVRIRTIGRKPISDLLFLVVFLSPSSLLYVCKYVLELEQCGGRGEGQTCMDSAVSFQVRAFGVHFAASGKVTLVNPSSL